MSTHISEELPRLLTGEAPRDIVKAAASHLRDCEDCQQELVSAVVAHASLTSAQRFAPELVNGTFRIADTDDSAGDDAFAASIPDLSALFSQAREEAASVSTPSTRNRSRKPLLAAASVAAALIVAGTATAVLHGGSHSSTGRSVALTAFDTGYTSAKATFVSHDAVKVDATSLPVLDATHRYEVWLTNPARTQMQPIGWIGSDGKATLTVPQSLVSEYTDLEVSVQSVDASTYTYSGTSVLRGAYGA